MHWFTGLAMLAVLACRPAGPATIPVATADQSVHDAVVLVCDSPRRAEADRRAGVSPSDAIAGHLTDGIGNLDVLTTVEGWKTDGINRAELDALIAQAQITRCPLRDTLG